MDIDKTIDDLADKLKRAAHARGYAKWLADDLGLIYKRQLPKWKSEFKYFRKIIEQGYTVSDIHKMDMGTYNDFRKKSGLFDDPICSGLYDHEVKPKASPKPKPPEGKAYDTPRNWNK